MTTAMHRCLVLPLGLGGSEQVDLDCGVDAAQAADVGGQRGPVPGSGDVYDVSGTAVEDIGVKEQPVHPTRCRSVEVTEHH